jgi:hypothetical protein
MLHLVKKTHLLINNRYKKTNASCKNLPEIIVNSPPNRHATVKEDQRMGLTMRERKAVIKQTAARYRRSSKKQKGKILDEFIAITGYNRKYAGWVLRNWGKKRYIRMEGQLIEVVTGTPRKKKRKARQRTYGPEVMKALKKIWYVFDCPCGKRLVPILHSMLPVLEKFGEIPRDAALGEKLCSISAATVDRLLQVEKRRLHISGVAHTPGRGRFSNTRSPSAPSEIGMSRSRGLRSWTW